MRYLKKWAGLNLYFRNWKKSSVYLVCFLLVFWGWQLIPVQADTDLSTLPLLDNFQLSNRFGVFSVRSQPSWDNGNSWLHLNTLARSSEGISGPIDDPRTVYDTPDPADPVNINKFRVKTHHESDIDVKNRLVAGNVYQQIQEYKNEGQTAYVSTPNELLNALWNRPGAYQSTDKIPKDTTAPANPITHIVLTKDIVITQGKTINGYQSFTSISTYTKDNIPNRNIVIDGIDPTGQKHTLEINGSPTNARINIASNSYTSTFVMNNINLQGTDYYGVVSAKENPVDKRIIYRNITYQGAQLAASYATNVTFAGDNNIKSTISYRKLEPVANGVDDKGKPTYNNAALGEMAYAIGFSPKGVAGTYHCQQLMECNNVTFAYNTRFIGSSPNDICLRLGYNNNNQSNIDVMDYANVDLTSSNRKTQEFAEPSLISLKNGKMEVHPHAHLTLHALTYRLPGESDPTDGEDLGSEPDPDPDPDSGSGTTTNSSVCRNLIQLDPSANKVPTSFTIDDYATVDARKDGLIDKGESGAVYISKGAMLTVGKWAYLKIISTNADFGKKVSNTASYAKPILAMDDGATVRVEQPGTFDLRGDGEFTKNRSLIQLGTNSIFQFNRARLVNIEYDGTQPTTNLISMTSGNMEVENMDVYAWNRDNAQANVATESDPFQTGLAAANYQWNSIFHFVANYDKQGFTGIDPSATSLFPSEIQQMKTNYNTNNFKRVSFCYIPTVYFSDFTSQPNDDPNDPNSKQISGRVVTDDLDHPDGDNVGLADAYVRVNGHVQNSHADFDQPILSNVLANPEWAELNDSGIDITTNFSTKTDANGYFTVTTKPSQTLMASDLTDLANANPKTNGRLQVFAFKNGNYNFANVGVLDKVAPKGNGASTRYVVAGGTIPSPENFVDISSLSDYSETTHSNGFTSSYTYAFDPRNLASDPTFWTTPGSPKTVYISVSDPAGNMTTIQSQVQIVANPVFIKVNVPHAIVKIPDGSAAWTNAQWQNWVKTANPNQVQVIKINADGSTTDLGASLTNNATTLKIGKNNIDYQVTTSTGDTLTASGVIELRSDTLQIKLPQNLAGTGNAVIDFGRYGSFNTGYLKPKETRTYPVTVIDDRLNQANDWKLELKANSFTDSRGKVMPPQTLGLGLLTPDDIFSDLFSEQLLAESTGDITLDLITGNQINQNQSLTIQRPTVDSHLNGLKYTASLTWTLLEATP